MKNKKYKQIVKFISSSEGEFACEGKEPREVMG
jgi:hypothetical protein